MPKSWTVPQPKTMSSFSIVFHNSRLGVPGSKSTAAFCIFWEYDGIRVCVCVFVCVRVKFSDQSWTALSIHMCDCSP